MTTCNVKGANHCDKPTENYHLTLQFFSALQRVAFTQTFCTLRCCKHMNQNSRCSTVRESKTYHTALGIYYSNFN